MKKEKEAEAATPSLFVFLVQKEMATVHEHGRDDFRGWRHLFLSFLR
ncbi:MAG: hypothetical protein GXY55_14395 [Phycisphaerae bacterium]|nr:hypothetical protein [Phycisphaerae bacterium]